MPTPILTNDLFKFSDDIQPYVDDDVIIIDNIYQEFDKITNLLSNIVAPNWKINNKSRNFKDYYDCRPIIPVWRPNRNILLPLQKICDLIESTYCVKGVKATSPRLKEFNLFKHINLPDQDPNKDMQFFPHVDSPFTAIITIDSVCSGGTAIYDIDSNFSNEETTYLFCDVSSFPKKVIPSKPNRMIIFESTRYHGGYIDDHKKYLNDWRMNEVIFFDV